MDPLIDHAQLMESLRAIDDDAASALKMALGFYLEDAPQLVGAIAQAAAQTDFEQLRFAAHSLKSSSATLGAKRLAKLCQQMELKARSGDSSNLAELNQQIQATYQATLALLQSPGLL